MTDTPTESRDTGEWDPLTTRLQQLRVQAGEPSYGEIARRVARLRSEAGRSEHEARWPAPPSTTPSAPAGRG
ncbi:hypothetical protein [Nocardioides marinisabuli]|uniref:hypothetical protein n=1 Tax=Nocardioides marinisabuli TaxID=419476 RepID=UPI0015DF8EE7|nr:hypothetical protein [Nocardioides marinisabuli]